MIYYNKQFPHALRGMIKWKGMFLSEHTESRQERMKNGDKEYRPSKRMTNDQIEKIAYQSIANNFICILTLNEVDTDGKNLQTKQKIKSINYPYIVTDQNYYLINDIYSLQTI